MDDKVHEGVIAQDIEKAVPSAVVKNADGYRVINENELTNATAATVGELSRRVITLENILKARFDKITLYIIEAVLGGLIAFILVKMGLK